MKCPKCSGLMFIERFADYFLTFHAWKCINCGAIMDQTILSNKIKTKDSQWNLTDEPELLEVSDN